MVSTKSNTKIFKALSEINRLRILKLLQKKPMFVNEITNALYLSASTISAHLHILLRCGFLVERREGKWVKYSLNPLPKDPRVSAIISTLDFWTKDLTIKHIENEELNKKEANELSN